MSAAQSNQPDPRPGSGPPPLDDIALRSWWHSLTDCSLEQAGQRSKPSRTANPWTRTRRWKSWPAPCPPSVVSICVTASTSATRRAAHADLLIADSTPRSLTAWPTSSVPLLRCGGTRWSGSRSCSPRLWLISAVVGFLLGLVRLAVIVILAIALVGWIVGKKAHALSRLSRAARGRPPRRTPRDHSEPGLRRIDRPARSPRLARRHRRRPRPRRRARARRAAAARSATPPTTLPSNDCASTKPSPVTMRSASSSVSSSPTSSATRSKPSTNVTHRPRRARRRGLPQHPRPRAHARRHRARRDTPARDVRAGVAAARPARSTRPSVPRTDPRRRRTSCGRRMRPAARSRAGAAADRGPAARRGRRRWWPSRRRRR